MNEAAKAGFIHIGDKLKIEDIDDFQPTKLIKESSLCQTSRNDKK